MRFARPVALFMRTRPGCRPSEEIDEENGVFK